MVFARASNCITPIMTASNAPSGIASSGNEQAAYPAWKAFNGAITDTSSDLWVTYSGTTVTYVAFALATSAVANSCNIWTGSGVYGCNPKNFTIEGWNGSWVVLGTYVDTPQVNTELTKQSFFFKNTYAYSNYRINIQASNRTDYSGISELEFCYTPPAPKVPKPSIIPILATSSLYRI